MCNATLVELHEHRSHPLNASWKVLEEDGLGEMLPIGEEGAMNEQGEFEDGGDMFDSSLGVQEAYPPGTLGTPLNPWKEQFGLGGLVPPGSRAGMGASQGTINSIATPFPGQQRGLPTRGHLQTAMSSPTVRLSCLDPVSPMSVL